MLPLLGGKEKRDEQTGGWKKKVGERKETVCPSFCLVERTETEWEENNSIKVGLENI